jgi:phosphate acetyltransferase
MKNGAERRLFIAATSQNDGKTTCTLGLIKAFRSRATSIGFIKPIGQRYVNVDGMDIDEDSVLIQKVCGLTCPLKDMSPIAVERDFTRRFLDDPDGLLPGLERAIRASFAVAADGNDLVVIEGTGHAGVGDVFDLCNARVAQMLDARAIIVTRGGIGQPIDEIAVNRSLFEQAGVPVVGVIANKVRPDKLEQTHHYLSKAFSRKGLALLGTLPYIDRLTWPTVADIAQSLRADVLNARQCLDNEVAAVLVGAMTPHNALKRVVDKSLIIVPGDRDDLVLAAVTTDLLREDLELAGILLTGGLRLAPQTMELVARTHIPVLGVEDSTYDAAARVHDTIVKIRSTEDQKVQTAISLVREHVDLDTLWRAL